EDNSGLTGPPGGAGEPVDRASLSSGVMSLHVKQRVLSGVCRRGNLLRLRQNHIIEVEGAERVDEPSLRHHPSALDLGTWDRVRQTLQGGDEPSVAGVSMTIEEPLCNLLAVHLGNVERSVNSVDDVLERGCFGYNPGKARVSTAAQPLLRRQQCNFTRRFRHDLGMLQIVHVQAAHSKGKQPGRIKRKLPCAERVPRQQNEVSEAIDLGGLSNKAGSAKVHDLVASQSKGVFRTAQL